MDKPVSVMAGVGKSLWAVALSADGNQIAFRDERDPKSLDPNNRGQGQWRVFDLLRRKLMLWTNPDDFKPVRQFHEWNDWTVKPSLNNAFLWYAVTPEAGNSRCRSTKIATACRAATRFYRPPTSSRCGSP